MPLNQVHGPLLSGHANTWYLDAIDHIIRTGDRVLSRGRETYEILHAQTVLPDPRKRVLTIPHRRPNPFFQAAETVWILAGRCDAEWILRYNSQLAKFLDPKGEPIAKGMSYTRYGLEFHGAYGERLRYPGRNRSCGYYGSGAPDQLRDILRKLKDDPGSRRAAAVLYNPEFDHADMITLDLPCNIALTFQYRNRALHAATFNRSNDLNLGLAYTNIVQFTTIQEFLAAALGIDPGPYLHHSSSLHVYVDDPIVSRLLDISKAGSGMFGYAALASKARANVPRFDVYEYVEPTPMSGVSFEEIERMAETHGEEYPKRCPYWSSIAAMLRAWNVLNYGVAPEDDPGALAPDVRLRKALGILRDGVRAQDWYVACLEYLWRWANRRKVGNVFSLTAEIAFHRFETPDFVPIEKANAVWNFITHDKGD